MSPLRQKHSQLAMSVNRLSRVLGPLRGADPKLVNANKLLSKSTKLFSDEGLARMQDGKIILLPLLVRSMRKLESITHDEMQRLSAMEILLPSLVSENLLEATGRNGKEELFRLKDRTQRRLVLAPTNEEAVTNLLGRETNLRESTLPIRFYQIGTKFRDEAHPKHGLLRAKEFIMKDLYCFDSSPESRDSTYKEVVEVYNKLFQRLQLPYLCVASSGSDMFGKESHEFHFLSDIGEDTLMQCNNCGNKVNTNLVKNTDYCPKCSSTDINIENGIEVGHAFNIGTTYSESLNAKFIDKNGQAKLLELSCYGIGITRILGAVAEILSTESELRWTLPVAPFTVCIIPPKGGSNEESKLEGAVNDMYLNLSSKLNDDVVIDDRTKLTIGKRLIMDRKLGFPFIVIFGSTMLNETPKVEVYDLTTNDKLLLHPADAVSTILSRTKDRLHHLSNSS